MHLGMYLVGLLLVVLLQEATEDSPVISKGTVRFPPHGTRIPGRVLLKYCHGVESVFEIDFCRILPCCPWTDTVYLAEKYMCVGTGPDGEYLGRYACRTWSQVSWITHPGYNEGYYPLTSRYKVLQKGITLTRKLIGIWKAGLVMVKQSRERRCSLG